MFKRKKTESYYVLRDTKFYLENSRVNYTDLETGNTYEVEGELIERTSDGDYTSYDITDGELKKLNSNGTINLVCDGKTFKNVEVRPSENKQNCNATPIDISYFITENGEILDKLYEVQSRITRKIPVYAVGKIKSKKEIFGFLNGKIKYQTTAILKVVPYLSIFTTGNTCYVIAR